MTAVEKIEIKLKQYPTAQYSIDGDTIMVEATDSNGFAVWLTENKPGYTVGYDEWHDEFDDEEDALNAFAFGLCEDCRLKVIQRGESDCSWTLEGKDDNGQWSEDSTTGLLLVPFWRKKSTIYRQNKLFKTSEQSGDGDADQPSDQF